MSKKSKKTKKMLNSIVQLTERTATLLEEHQALRETVATMQDCLVRAGGLQLF